MTSKFRHDKEARSKKISQAKAGVDGTGGQNRKKRFRENDRASGKGPILDRHKNRYAQVHVAVDRFQAASAHPFSDGGDG